METEVSRTGWRARRYAAILGGLMLLAVIGAWSQRKPIATDFIDDELERRDVAARYEVADIGLRRQRLENISIGDPASPDLTAEWAEVDVIAGFGGVRVRAIRAGGVRLRGRLIDGVLDLGAVDRMLPPPTGKPFALPDLLVTLDDARMRLDTPVGAFGLKIDGHGNLANGFRGKLAALAPSLDLGDCAVDRATAYVDVAINQRRPAIEGPIRANAIRCPESGLLVARPTTTLDAVFTEALDGWRGSAQVAMPMLRYQGDRIDSLAGRVSFVGNSERTQGEATITAETLAIAGVNASGFEFAGDYSIGPARDGLAASVDGSASLRRVALGAERLGSIASLSSGLGGTPLAPIADAIAAATIRAGRGLELRSGISLRMRGGTGTLTLSRLLADSESGARLTLDGGAGVRIGWPGGGSQVDGTLRLDGGGFPDATVRLRQAAPGAAIDGIATVAPYSTGGARISLTPVRFSAAGGRATRFETRVTLDGPLADGRVNGLTLPIMGRLDGRGGFAVNPGCVPMTFDSLSISGLDLDPARLRLCPADGRALIAGRDGNVGGGARIDAPRLAGTLGETPITLAATGARVGFGAGGFTIADLQARLGEAGSVTRLDFAEVAGRFSGGVVSGSLAGGSGKIANVPLLVTEAAGDWRLDDGVFTVAGGLRVADEANPPRFEPLVSNDFAFRLADNRITAEGTLREPATQIAVTDVDIVHQLGAGTGQAVLDVPGIAFGEALQPEELTRLTLGVVANVEGVVTGQGTIHWTPEGVTSDGVFRTADMDLAAAFGPVTGLATEIRFTDLLGLVSEPNQLATVATINPGILVEDGAIRYQLIADQRVQVEGGRWPFAGGELILDPTLLGFGEAQVRELTFRIVGLDAAVFIQRLEFDNLSATGIFDGTIPMIFDANGGRIEDGRLAARPPGGTIAYVGEVSNADLGIWGSIAFDALKSIAYENLTIALDGDIDGEMVTEVRFNGVSRGTIQPVATGLLATIGGQIAREIQQIPFIFNINIKAPFRQLINTARSFSDPALLIRETLPPELQPAPEAQPVQPQESETVR